MSKTLESRPRGGPSNRAGTGRSAPRKLAEVAPTSATIGQPAGTRWLFTAPAAGWVWLVPRVWLGYEWLHSGVSKIWGADSQGFWGTGLAVRSYANRAIASSEGPHAQVAYGWWVHFLRSFVVPHYSWIAKLVATSEFAVGAALILGLLTGVAALGGLALNYIFVLSGTSSINPIMMLVGALVLLAWRNAGYVGADRVLLPTLGAPWRPGWLTSRLLRHVGP